MPATNLCAPDLPRELSPTASEQVAEMLAKRETSPFATPDDAAIRRDPAHDLSTPLRPSFVRDSEKIIHMPAYNRMSGKTQVFSFRATTICADAACMCSWSPAWRATSAVPSASTST